MKPDKFQDSLESLDLPGLLLVIGLLTQRALEITLKPKEESKILKPKVIIE